MAINLGLFLLLLVIGVVVAAVDPDGPTIVSISPIRQAFTASEPVFVMVTFENTAGSPKKFVKFDLPFGELSRPLFSVTVDGKTATYLGRLVNHRAIPDEDRISLNSRASQVYNVELSKFYDFSATGTYTVAYVRNGLQSAPISFQAEGRASASEYDDRSIVTASCSTTQQPLLTSAMTFAINYTINANSYFAADTRTSRYTTWFGKYSLPRYTFVQSNFGKILNVLQNQTITFDCSCNIAGGLSYVYPAKTENKRVYLCPDFWRYPTSGKESKAGVMVHEISHFNDVGKTDDLSFLQSGAKKLAVKKPIKAIINADSYKYFAENNPFKS